MLAVGPAFAALSEYSTVVAVRAVIVLMPDEKLMSVEFTQMLSPIWRPWSVMPAGSVSVSVSTLVVRWAVAMTRFRTLTMVAVPPPLMAVAAKPILVEL